MLDAAGRTIDLRPQAYGVLRHLAIHAGRLVDKTELLDAVWPNVVVTDDSIVQAIGDARRALGPTSSTCAGSRPLVLLRSREVAVRLEWPIVEDACGIRVAGKLLATSVASWPLCKSNSRDRHTGRSAESSTSDWGVVSCASDCTSSA